MYNEENSMGKFRYFNSSINNFIDNTKFINTKIRELKAMDKKTSDAQTKANKKWAESNREYSSYLRSRSSARSFIKNKATDEDLNELEKLINERREQLKSLD